jgi:hypothetical protein
MGIVDLENIFQIQNELADYIKKNHSEFWDESKQPFEGYRKFMNVWNINTTSNSNGGRIKTIIR